MSQVVDSHGDIETAAAAAQVYDTDVSPGTEVSSGEQAYDHDIVESIELNGSDLDKELNGKRSSDNSMESDVQEITIELHKTTRQPESSTPMPPVEDYEHSPECRICKGNEGELVVACKCSGTSQHVHLDCLKKWIEIRPNEPHPTQENYFVPNLRCEICHEQYNVQLQRKFVLSSKYALDVFFSKVQCYWHSARQFY